jgi:hypothetical protein
MPYGRYNKEYEFGPTLRGEAKKNVEAHETAVQVLLHAPVPWLDVYDGELKKEMAEQFITNLRYGDLSELEVVETYLDGSFDVDALLDSRLEAARAARLETVQQLGGTSLRPTTSLQVALCEHPATGYLLATTFEEPLVRSFG